MDPRTIDRYLQISKWRVAFACGTRFLLGQYFTRLSLCICLSCVLPRLWRLLGLQMLRGDKCPTHRKKQGGKRSYHVWRIFSSEQVTVQPVLRDSLPPVETTGHLSDSRKVPRDCEAPVARGGADAAEEGQVDNGEVPRGAGAIVVRRTGQACFPWCDDDRVYPLSLKGDSCFTTSILWSPHFLGWAWTLSVSFLGVASSVLSLGSLPAAQTRAQRVCEWAPKRGEPPARSPSSPPPQGTLPLFLLARLSFLFCLFFSFSDVNTSRRGRRRKGAKFKRKMEATRGGDDR